MPYYPPGEVGNGTVTSIVAGNGLTGGTITTSGTLAVGQGTGITVTAGLVSTVQNISTAGTPQFTRLGIGAAAGATTELTVTQAVATTGSPTLLTVTGAAHTGLTALTEATDVNFNLARTVQFATGALTTQRAVQFSAPTYGFVGASTLTSAATVYISGAPVAGTNATITNAYALWVDSGSSRFDGLIIQNVTATSGNMYALAWESATTLISATTGITIDGNTNVTPAAQTLTGCKVTLPGATNASGQVYGVNATFVTSTTGGDTAVAVYATGSANYNFVDAILFDATLGKNLTQARLMVGTPTFSPTVTANPTNMGCIFWGPTVSAGSGVTSTVDNVYTTWTNDCLLIGVGTKIVTAQYGHYISNLTAGTTSNYGVYIVGAYKVGATNYSIYVDAGFSRFDASGMTVASAAGAVLRAFTVGTPGSTDTVIISGGTNITTTTGFNFFEIQAPTYSNALVVVTNAATLYVSGAPVATGGGSITNAYALWVDAGTSAFGGAVVPDVSDVAALGSSTLMWGDLFLASGGVINWNIGNVTLTQAAGALTLTSAPATSGVPTLLTVTGAAHTGLTASTDIPDVKFNFARLVQFATGALTNQRAFQILAPTYGFVGTSTLTNAATFYIDRAPQVGGNATITNAYTLWIDAGNSRFDTSQSIATATSATLNAFTIPADTITLTGSNAITTAAGFNLVNIGQPTYDNTISGSCVVTAAATLYISNAPAITGAGASITSAMALWVGAGKVRFDGGGTSSQITAQGGALAILASTVNGNNASSTIAIGTAVNIGVTTYTNNSATLTMTDAASLYIAGIPVASTNVTFTNTAMALWVDAGTTRLDGRLLCTQGADVGSGTSLTLGSDGNTFEITGTTQIDQILITGWQNGSVITLVFNESVTVRHAVATSGSNVTILLAGAGNFSATANDTLTLVLCETTATGQAWRELARTAI